MVISLDREKAFADTTFFHDKKLILDREGNIYPNKAYLQ